MGQRGKEKDGERKMWKGQNVKEKKKKKKEEKKKKKKGKKKEATRHRLFPRLRWCSMQLVLSMQVEVTACLLQLPRGGSHKATTNENH